METMKKISLISALSCVVISIILCCRWKNIGPIFLFLPPFIFSIGYLLLLKFTKKWIATSCFILGMISVLLAGLMSLCGDMWMMATIPVTDIRKYERLMPNQKTDVDQHFPRKIPKDATNISFYYLPKFLMGDGHIQLRLKRPSEEIKKLYQEFSSKKIKSFTGSDADKRDELYLAFHTSGSKDINKFPSDYEIMLLGEYSDQGKHGGHGDQYGVAISLEKSEIVYWLDMW